LGAPLCDGSNGAFRHAWFMSHNAFFVSGKRNAGDSRAMIEVQIDKLLKKHDRTFYWLAKETGISHTTLWRLKKRKALGINFDTLEKLCQALDCQPGDVLSRVNRKPPKRRANQKAVTR
jgi:putative transcriptional regulator